MGGPEARGGGLAIRELAMTSNVLSIRATAANPEQPWSDEAVAAACCTGDPRAIGELFDRFEIPVTRFLSRLVGGGDVEDLVQNTFLQIVRGRARYDGRSSVKTWLFCDRDQHHASAPAFVSTALEIALDTDERRSIAEP